MRDRQALVAVAPYGVRSASTRVRVEEWLRRVAPKAERSYYLGTADLRPGTMGRRPLGLMRAELALRGELDVRGCRLLLHREAAPFSRGGIERRLLRRAAHTVYDIDDALYTDTSGSRLRRFFKPPEKFAGMAADADVTVAGNDLVAEWAAKHCRSVVVIPTCVEPADYVQKTDYRVADPPVVGWIGSFSGIRHLALMAGALDRLHERTGARLEVIADGSPLPPWLARFGTSVKWSEETARQRLATWDVGVMPVTDTPFDRGKSAYKLLQYSAAGVPAIATPLGANEAVLAAMGAPGPRTEDEWFEALWENVTASGEVRSGWAARGRAVAAGYSYDKWMDTWRRVVGMNEESAMSEEQDCEVR